MRIGDSADLGRYVQQRRRARGLTQRALAEHAGVSRRWLSDLENGKATAEIGLVLLTLRALEVVIDLRPYESTADFDAYLEEEFGVKR